LPVNLVYDLFHQELMHQPTLCYATRMVAQLI